MLPTGAKPGLTPWDGVDRSLDTDQWTTKGYKIENGVFTKNPEFRSKAPTTDDLVSTLHRVGSSRSGYTPTHRQDTALERARKLLGTQTVGRNPGYPVIKAPRVNSKRHRRD